MAEMLTEDQLTDFGEAFRLIDKDADGNYFILFSVFISLFMICLFRILI